MLTTRNNKNGLAAIAGVVSRGLINELARNSVNYVGDALTGGRQANLPRPEFKGGAIVRMQKMPRPQKKGRNKKKSRARVGPDSIARLPSGFDGGPVDDRITVTLRDALSISNTAAGVTSIWLQFACVYTATRDMRTWLPRAGTTLATSFRFFKIKKARFCFQPTLAYTSSGYVTIGVEPAPDAVGPATLGDVVKHHPSVLGDVKDAHSIVWVPGDNTEGLDKLTNAGAVVTAPEAICQGVFQLQSGNSELIAVQIGILTYEVDIEFFGLT